MTKDRCPLTPYRALMRIAERIGYDGCAAVTGKTEWTIRKYADPDTERSISLRDAMRLDLAYRREGGEGAPLFEAYAARLELDANPLAGADILAASRDAAREGGEAIDHALSAITGGTDRKRAIREVSEAVSAFLILLNRLKTMKGTK